MYEPVSIPRPLTRRRVGCMLVVLLLLVVGGVVVVWKTRPREPLPERLTLDQLAMMVPDAAESEALAAIVRSRLANLAANATPPPEPVVCTAPDTPTAWNETQRANAKTIVEVGLALGMPERGLIIAVATAMQESSLYNLGHLGERNDHDSLGLFQQRPSMGWGTPEQVTDPVYSATAFYLALQRVPNWESLELTVAAQSVQRSAFPNAYAKWEADATALTQQILCTVAPELRAQ
jgi:hypothetical protein